MLQRKRFNFESEYAFLKTNDFTTVTVQLPNTLGVADTIGRLFVQAGTVYPANDATAIGIVLNDVEVTGNDDVGALIVRGDIIKSALPVELNSAAQTALESQGFRFYPLESQSSGEVNNPES